MSNTLSMPRSSWYMATSASRASFRPNTHTHVDPSSNPARMTTKASSSHSMVAEPSWIAEGSSQNQAFVMLIFYYSPMTFTHQGAPWHPGADRWIGTRWDPEEEATAVHADLAALAAWADNGVPAFVSSAPHPTQPRGESRCAPPCSA